MSKAIMPDGRVFEMHDTRMFETGATRDVDTNKLAFEGFLSPIVLRRYAEYMHGKRLNNIPAGETIRAPDNWQKGIPQNTYIDSGIRHMIEWWLIHRGFEARDEKGNVMKLQDVLCAIMFNVMGYLHEELKKQQAQQELPLEHG